MATKYATNIFYDPNSTYGGKKNLDTAQSSLQGAQDKLQDGVYFGWLTKRGYGGLDRQSEFARSMEGYFQTGYKAAQQNNPGLTFRQYLNQIGGKATLQRLWAQASPTQRGENPAQFAQRARWIGRG